VTDRPSDLPPEPDQDDLPPGSDTTAVPHIPNEPDVPDDEFVVGADIFGNHHLDDALLGGPEDEGLERLRAFCAMLPETTEIDGLGNPTFRVATKGYAIFEVIAGQAMVCVKLPLDEQAALISRSGFEAEPHTGDHGWTLVELDGAVHWDEVDELVIASYRLVAPPEYVAQLDALLAGG